MRNAVTAGICGSYLRKRETATPQQPNVGVVAARLDDTLNGRAKPLENHHPEMVFQDLARQHNESEELGSKPLERIAPNLDIVARHHAWQAQMREAAGSLPVRHWTDRWRGERLSGINLKKHYTSDPPLESPTRKSRFWKARSSWKSPELVSCSSLAT